MADRCSRLHYMTADGANLRSGKVRRLALGTEYDLPNVPRHGGSAAVATSATENGVLVMFGLHSVLLNVEDTRRLADYLKEGATWVEFVRDRAVPRVRRKQTPLELLHGIFSDPEVP